MRRRRAGPGRGEIREWAAADLAGPVSRHAVDTQQVFGHPVGGSGVVALGLFVQQLAQSQQRCSGHRQREFGSSTRKRPPRVAALMSRSARGARPRSDRIGPRPTLSSTRLCSGRRRNSRPVNRKLRANISAGSSTSGRLSSSAPWASKISLSAAWTSCSLLWKWLWSPAGAFAFPTPRRRRSGLDRHPRRHRDQRTAEACAGRLLPAARGAQMEDLLLRPGQESKVSARRRRSGSQRGHR